MLWELHGIAECPFCETENHGTFCFDMDEADQGGVNSKMMEIQCDNFDCEKKFYAKTFLSFDIDRADTFKRKPKVAQRGEKGGAK